MRMNCKNKIISKVKHKFQQKMNRIYDNNNYIPVHLLIYDFKQTTINRL